MFGRANLNGALRGPNLNGFPESPELAGGSAKPLSKGVAMKIWTKQEIAAKLSDSPKWRARALLAIYKNQTDAEKAAGRTIVYNGVGFNGADALPLTRIAKKMLRGEGITPNEWRIISRRIHKYAGQLANIANSRKSI